MRAYERFLQYVKVYTTSDEESSTHPTTARQLDLGRMLVAQLKELGLKDARLDEYGYVYATLPATPGCEQAAGLGFIAHMDTAPGTSGENVNPQIHENYDGGDVVLPATGAVLKPAEFPFLSEMKGQTLITTDGSTLLGADDKAGVAEIMTMAERLIREGRPHGKICIASPRTRRSARGRTCSMWTGSAQPTPTRWTATMWGRSATKTSTLQPPPSRSTACRSTPAAPRTPCATR